MIEALLFSTQISVLFRELMEEKSKSIRHQHRIIHLMNKNLLNLELSKAVHLMYTLLLDV